MNIEELTEQQISARIHYLDPDTDRESSAEADSPALVICVSFLFLLLGCLGLFLLFRSVH